MIAQTEVKYNRSQRSWQAINGTVTDFGPGQEAKRQAELLALAHDHPRLYRRVVAMAAQHGHRAEVVDRLIKAARLIDAQQIFENSVVSTSGEVYKIAYEFCRWTCTCKDFAFGAPMTNYGRMCKHTLARLICDLEGTATPVAIRDRL